MEQTDLDSYKIVPQRVRKLLKAGKNVMLHGAAGTGKSTILKAITKHNKNTVVLAPTGIAALSVGGQTIHSFFGFSFGYLSAKDIKGCGKQAPILRKKPLIIIDEVSMVRADVFNAIDLSLRRCLFSNLPFAGLQILLLGDTGQLPPIVTEQEAQFFKSGNEMFFRSASYKLGKFIHVELDEIHRQTNEKFIDFLLNVRKDSARRRDMEWFNSKVEVMDTDEYFATDTSDSTVLCMTNARASDYNNTMYNNLDGPETVYEARVVGRFNESEYPTDYELGLKVGSKVVLLKNSKAKNFVNGSVGTVTRLESDAVHVNIKGTECRVEADTWEKYAYVASEYGVEKQVIGSFKQIPVKLAWAITVHKSQGMTLNRFHLDLDRRSFAHGQMYVALSRARSIKGISVTRALSKSDVIVDQSKIMQLDEEDNDD